MKFNAAQDVKGEFSGYRQFMGENFSNARQCFRDEGVLSVSLPLPPHPMLDVVVDDKVHLFAGEAIQFGRDKKS
ncbi:MAG: hypothetical protein L0226_00375 [Acidobacteria bacterium]|nr:hypothetical protein [Acidobacteriota bacterium]